MAQSVVRRVKHCQKFDNGVQPWSKVLVHGSKESDEAVRWRNCYAMLSAEIDDNEIMDISVR